MARKIKFIKKDNETAICPHCDKKLDEVFFKAKGMWIFYGRTSMYFCPHCKKVLGFAQGSGTW